MKRGPLGLTQAMAAAELQMTQGAFTQYLNQHIVVNDAFVRKLCQLLEIDPATIDPEWPTSAGGERDCAPRDIRAWGTDAPEGAPGVAVVRWPPDTFGVVLPDAGTPYPPGAVAVVCEGVVEPALGFIARRGGWRFVDAALVPADVMQPLTVLAVLAGGDRHVE